MDLKLDVLSYILSGFSLASLWLMGNKNKIGSIVGIIGQSLWVVYALMLKQPGLLIGVIAYTIVHIRNLIKWKTEDAKNSG
jgi:hypothetical protein